MPLLGKELSALMKVRWALRKRPFSTAGAEFRGIEYEQVTELVGEALDSLRIGSFALRAIFISYRREDAEGEAGRLFDDLVEAFGEHSVFMDVAAIEPGRDFRKVIDDSVATCGVLLAIIGRNWLGAKDETGKRRLDNPTDFVRLETASALKRNIPVIPVLVHGAHMPRAEELPENLQELAYRNGVEITGPRWRSDVQLLIKALRPHVEQPVPQGQGPVVGGKGGTGIKPAPEPLASPPSSPPPTRWWRRPASTISTIFVVVVALAYFLRPAASFFTSDYCRSSQHPRLQ